MPKTVLRSLGQKASLAASTGLSLQERKQALVRDAIWEAAIDLFSEKGFDETTIDDIAKAAGTSRRSFFRYFESKNDLMAQPMASYGSSLADAIRRCPSDYSPPEVLRRTLLTVASESARHPRTRKIMEIAARYPAARDAQIARAIEVEEQVAEEFARRFKKGSREQTYRDKTMARVLAALTLSILSVTYRTWFENGEADIARTLDQVVGRVSEVTCHMGGVPDRKGESYTKRHRPDKIRKKPDT